MILCNGIHSDRTCGKVRQRCTSSDLEPRAGAIEIHPAVMDLAFHIPLFQMKCGVYTRTLAYEGRMRPSQLPVGSGRWQPQQYKTKRPRDQMRLS